MVALSLLKKFLEACQAKYFVELCEKKHMPHDQNCDFIWKQKQTKQTYKQQQQFAFA